MSTTDLLQEIRDRLGDLPSRLAGVIGSSGQARNTQGQFSSAGGGKSPDMYDSTQRLAGALGRISPIFGQLAGAMGAVREIESAWKQFSAARWPTSGGASTIPGPQATIGKIPSFSSPNVPTAQLASTSSQSLGTPKYYAGGTMSGLPGSQDLVATNRALIEEIRRLREVMRQQEPDQGEDTERLPSKEIEEGPESAALDELNKRLGFSLGGKMMPAKAETMQGPFRPETKVPSSKEEGDKTMETIGALLKVLG